MKKINFPPNFLAESNLGTASNDLLYIGQTGWKAKKKLPEYTRRKHGRVDWQIIYISEGFGYFEYNNVVKKIGPNALVVFKPNSPQLYAYMPEECPIANYIHFSGKIVDELMEQFGLTGQDYYDINSAFNEEITKKFLSLHSLRIANREQNSLCWGAFIDLLALFSQIIHSDNLTPRNINTNYDDALSTVLENMHNDLCTKYPVSYYAEQMNLSVSHFAHIFKKHIGISPIQYRNILRINNAKTLLLTTNLSIEDIAFQLGYTSVSIFSKRFKEATNLSPLNYRKSRRQ